MQAITFPSYPIFEADQVLTSKHLNELVGYLEEQERLTRNKLIGIGIACGLELGLNSDRTVVSISAGVGITSDGHLIVFHGENPGETAQFQFFKKFEFIDRSAYPFFVQGGQTIDVFELYPNQVEASERFTELEGGIEGYAVLLFLDCLDKKLKNCVENDCNEKGTERSFTVRPLLVRRAEMRNIICREEELDVPKSEADLEEHVNARYHLQALAAPRFRLNNQRLTHYNDLFVRYENLITGYLPALQTALRECFRLFRPLLRNEFGTANPFAQASTDLQQQYLATKKKAPFAVQYFHDLLRDLTDTYNEFREAAFELMSECCPPPGRFPKHLRLGHLGNPVQCEPSPYRTGFLHAPIHNGQTARQEQVISLFRKMVQLARSFGVPAVANFREQVKITPSYGAGRPLSERAIPYYYEVRNESAFLKNWNADRLRKCRYNENLGYFADRYATAQAVRSPLQFDHRQYDFLRIEGGLGMHYRSVLSQVLGIRNREGLPFDVVALKMAADASGSTIDFSECHFRDLEIMCEAWRKELACLLGDVVKGTTSVNVREALKGQMVAGGFRDTQQPIFMAAAVTQPLTFFSAGATAKLGDSVISNIELKDDSLGTILHEAVIIGQVGGGDYFVHAENKLLQNEFIRNLPREEYEVAFVGPMLVASQAIAFAQRVEGTCSDLDITKLEASMKALTKAATDYQTKLAAFKPTDAAKVQVNTVQMLRLMSSLIGRCTLEQLKIIKKEIERRKDLLRKMTLFSEYTLKNPGIEHDGGVPKGGTYILVYRDISKQDTVVRTGPFTLRGQVFDESDQVLIGATVSVAGTAIGTVTDLNGNFILTVNELPVTLQATLTGTATAEIEVADASQVIVLRPGGGGAANEVFPSPKRYEVFADFYLPYLCCSDCPPIDYVILPPEEKVALQLKDTTFCLPTDANFPGELFAVTPAGGTVSGPGVSGSVEAGFVFKPSMDMLGQANEAEVKGFKVNDQAVPLTVSVFRKPTAGFNFDPTPVEPVDGGGVANLVLVNTSSDFAVKFRWEILRAFIDGKIVENHIIETESRDTFEVQIFAKRGEKFTVKLTAFSEHCSDQIEQEIELKFQQRQIVFELLDPTGKKLEQPSISNRAEGAFTLVATPGQGKLLPEELVKKLKFKLSSSNAEANKYVFSSRGLDGKFEFQYGLAEGTTGSIEITFFKPRGGGFDLGPGGTVVGPGGSTVNPGGTRPGGSGTVRPGGGTVSPGGSTVRPGGNLAISGLLSNQPTVLNDLRTDGRFRSLLGPTSDAFRVTANLTETLNGRLSSGPHAQKLAEGAHNEELAEKLKVATSDTVKRLKQADKATDQQFIAQLLQTQLEQLVGVVTLLDGDLAATDPLSKLLTLLTRQVKKLTEDGVKINQGKALSKSLEKLATGLAAKPKAKEKIDNLIAAIKN